MARVPQSNWNRQEPPKQEEKPKEKLTLRIEWILVPLVLLGFLYLRQGHPVLTWERVMDLLNVHRGNRERYTMTLHLFLAVTGIVAAWKILGKKDK